MGASLVVASNRLPVVVDLSGDGEVHTSPSAGGLVSALRGLDRPHLWVGWPGTSVPAGHERAVADALAPDGLHPVFLSDAEAEQHYTHMCNETIWPLFHYFVSGLRFSDEAWAAYVAVNDRFADTIAGVAEPGARVWVHDFHLALVPAALRSRRPDLTIGFFLHIPFPSSEIYRLLPTRRELLHGILGADYVGFHTGDYVRHFRSACLRILGMESEPQQIAFDGRAVGIGAHPIGIDVEGFRATLEDPETARIAAELEQRYRDKQVVLGVERLDYTKGIPEKLDAFERILELEPERAANTTLLQVLVPSRLESAEYTAKRNEIEQRIAHLNGRFGQFGTTPVEYLHRSISLQELVALYRRADVMMVTPLRDGMNLVAQEYVLCQSAPEPPGGRHGTLLLSEFAGAAQVLPGALLVNPWDAGDLAGRLLQALALDSAERTRRLDLMADRVVQLESRAWARGFLARLERFATGPKPHFPERLDDAGIGRIARRLHGARRRTFLLDYDGTLRELVPHPSLAAPTTELRDVLLRLATLPRTDVHVVSGRTRESLDAWLGDLPVHLCAEHGAFAREPHGVWRSIVDIDLSWLEAAEELLRRTCEDVPGSVVERKETSVAWHYREAEPEYGQWRAHELLAALGQALSGLPAEVITGHRVIEIRARGVNKGLYMRHLGSTSAPGWAILAAGDDLTDDDLFDALPDGSIAVHVGPPRPRGRNSTGHTRYTVDTPAALRRALGHLVDDLSGSVAARRAGRMRRRSEPARAANG
jgi:trehalose 6-phosphate synthase/phosphatase